MWFWIILLLFVLVGLLVWYFWTPAVSTCSSSGDVTFGSLSSLSDVEAVFLTWDSAEKSGAEWLLPSGFNMSFGAGTDNLGLGCYNGLGVAIIYMENMQAQYNLSNLITNLQTLTTTFPGLKYVVGSGTCASFASSPSSRGSYAYPPDVAIGTEWVNGFTQKLSSGSSFASLVEAGAKALNYQPVSPGGSPGGGTCVESNTTPSVVLGTILSAGGDVYPGTVSDGTPSCQVNNQSSSCLSTNEAFLNANNTGVDTLLSSVGLTHGDADASTFSALETDDYYVAATMQKFLPSLEVMTSRGVINTYSCTGDDDTYKSYAAASAILTGADILSGM